MSWNFSIAKFGSTVRKDNDHLSDSDLLIVIDNDKNFDYNLLSDFLTGKNYNIAYYNYDKLKYLSKKGSLFIQHLKQESEIIIDNSELLKNILNEYKPKSSYQTELDSALNYFKSISILPNTNQVNLWYCDYLYVLLRNYLVFYTANNKEYIFSFRKLLSKIIQENNLSQATYKVLEQLRDFKHNYRSINSITINQNQIDDVVQALNKIGINVSISFVPNIQFREKVEGKIYNSNLPNYYKLRLQESIYRMLKIKNATLDNIFSNPQFYTPKYKSLEFIKNTMKMIKKTHNIV